MSFLKNIKKNKYKNNKYVLNYYSNLSFILNLRSKSWFKLEEINKKYNLFKNDISVIDLGSYPGGWSYYLSKKIKKINIFSCDIIEMKNISKVNFLKCNLLNENDINKFINFVYCNVDVILSDVLQNLSGHKSLDTYKNLNLLESLFKICLNKLKNNGSFVFKILQHKYIDKFINKIKYFFKKVDFFKPKSSNNNSREFYVIARNFNKL